MTLPVSSFCIRWTNVFRWDPPAAQNENKILSRKKNKKTEVLVGSSTSKANKSSFNASSVLRCLVSYAYVSLYRVSPSVFVSVCIRHSSNRAYYFTRQWVSMKTLRQWTSPTGQRCVRAVSLRVWQVEQYPSLYPNWKIWKRALWALTD